jgi:hypothetical protein
MRVSQDKGRQPKDISHKKKRKEEKQQWYKIEKS